MRVWKKTIAATLLITLLFPTTSFAKEKGEGKSQKSTSSSSREYKENPPINPLPSLYELKTSNLGNSDENISPPINPLPRQRVDPDEIPPIPTSSKKPEKKNNKSKSSSKPKSSKQSGKSTVSKKKENNK